MKAEEKAKELIEKYEEELIDFDVQLDSFNFPVNRRRIAKQCALICVDEILNSHEETYYNSFGQSRNNRDLDYWQQVKQEINKQLK